MKHRLDWTPADANIELGGEMVNVRAPSKIQLRGGLNHLCHEKGFRFVREIGNAKPIKNIVDVGANIGATALMFSHVFPEAHVLAIEPVSINWECLVHNVRGRSNISLMKMAAGRRKGTVDISMPSVEQRSDVTGNSGLFSIYGEGGDTERVRMDLLDNVAKRPVDLIKIDVEGAEADVLAGAHNIIREDRPIMIVELRLTNVLMAGKRPEDYKWYLEQVKYHQTGEYMGDNILVPDELDIDEWVDGSEFLKECV